MIKPTVGRVVLYQGYGSQPQAAIITYVHSDTCVNLAVFSPEGVSYPALVVALKQSNEQDYLVAPYAEWMPYQKGQAAKAEALEAKQIGG